MSKFSRLLTSIILILIGTMSTNIYAVQCDAVYPTGAQSHSGTGQLTVNSSARILGLPSPIVPFPTGVINASNGDSCETAECSVSGIAASALTLPTFPSIVSSNNEITSGTSVIGEGSLNFNTLNSLEVNSGTTSFSDNYTEYFIKNLTIQSSAQLNLKPGTYWIESINLDQSDSSINVVGDGTAYLYVTNLNVNNDAVINGLTTDAALSIGVYGDFNANSDATASGLIYVLGSLNADSNSVITGAVSATNLVLNSNATVNYQSTIIENYDFSEICEGSSTPTSPRICTNTISTAETGTLTDPGGASGDYGSNEECSFLIQPTSGGDITLSFESFEYGSAVDFLAVFDGDGSITTDTCYTNSPAPPSNLLGCFNGDDLPASLTATSGSMVIQHSTSTNFNFEGFVANWFVGEQLAFYEFEQDSWPSANTILDSSSKLNHGSPFGSISPILDVSAQKSCKALDVASNTSSGTISALNTNIDINDVGDIGTISFWYKSNQNWIGGGDRLLLDASTTTGIDYYFFLNLDNDGILKFAYEDTTDADLLVATSANNFSADTWVHIAITWDSLAINSKIFINGVEVTTTSDNNTSTGRSLSANLGELYIGDNSSTYTVPASTVNSANGQFDDVRIYNFQQTATQVAADASEVKTCESEPVAYYQFEQASWSGAGTVLDSSSNNQNGENIGDVSPILSSAQIACRFADIPENVGANSTARIAEFDAIDTGVDINTLGNGGARGSISFWYKSNENWNSGNARQLIDASTRTSTTTSPDKHFFLVLKSNGALQFSLEDADDRHLTADTNSVYSIASDTWAHVAVTWDLPTETIQIFVDGVSQTLTYNNSSVLIDTIADFNTIYIGDNHSDYFQFDSSGNSANGQFDEVRIYDFVQSEALVNIDKDIQPTCFVDHYLIEHDGEGLTCEAESVTIKACTDADCDNLSTESSTITLSPSGWVGGDTLTFTGSTTASLNITTASSITFSKVSASPDEPLKCLIGTTENCNFTFSDTGLLIIDTASESTVLPDQIAESSFSNLSVRAVEKDNDTGACQGAVSGTRNVTFGYDCASPDKCLTAFAGIPITDEDGNNTDTLSLTFDSDGIAPLPTLSYSDAGRLTLSAQTSADNGATLSGSNSIDIYPDQIRLSTDPASVSDTSSTYVAGVPFDFKIGAYGSAGGLLPNYQPGDLQMSLQRVTPNAAAAEEGTFKYTDDASGTRDTALTPSFTSTVALTFSGGEYNYDATYNEVGTINVDIRDADYLGNSIGSSGALDLGRFTPAYFEITQITTPTLNDTRSGSSYVGEYVPFSQNLVYEVTAKNADGQTTKNYGGSLWNLSLDGSHISFVDNTGNNGEIFGELSTNSTELDYDGIATYTITSPSTSEFSAYTTPLARIPKTHTAISPVAMSFTPVITTIADSADVSIVRSVVDSDGICFQTSYPSTCSILASSAIQGAEARYGRLTLESTFGPENEDLSVPIKVEYYSSVGQWLVNTDDNSSDIAFDLSLGQLTLTGDSTLKSLVGNISSVGTLTNGRSVGSQLGFSAPGIVGELTLELVPDASGVVWPEYLNFDWDGDSDIDTDDLPSATVSFGLFRGNDRIIHWREIFD